jgi:UDP-N-acetylmuramyl pentapeptide synthase
MRGTRAAVLAAFRRAHELGLSVEDVEKSLSPTSKKKS